MATEPAGHGAGPFGSMPFGAALVDPQDRAGISLFRKRAGEAQLRIEPANETASDPLGDIGVITVVGGASLVANDRFELRDLINPTIKFIFDKVGSVVETAVTRVVSIDGTETPEEIRDLCLAAIANTPALEIVATPVSTDQMQLDQPVPGPDGKGTAAEVVDDAGFTVALQPPDGSHVMCLGSDILLPPVEDYKIGDFIRVSQEVELAAGTKLVKLQARFRQPADLPVRELLPAGTTVEHVNRTGAVNLAKLITTSAFFTSAHVLRSVYLEGAGLSNGYYRIFEVIDPMNAVLNGLANPAVGTVEAADGYVRGAHWRVSVRFESIEVFAFDPGRDGGRRRDLQMPNLSINVARFSGSREIRYELHLTETP